MLRRMCSLYCSPSCIYPDTHTNHLPIGQGRTSNPLPSRNILPNPSVWLQKGGVQAQAPKSLRLHPPRQASCIQAHQTLPPPSLSWLSPFHGRPLQAAHTRPLWRLPWRPCSPSTVQIRNTPPRHPSQTALLSRPQKPRRSFLRQISPCSSWNQSRCLRSGRCYRMMPLPFPRLELLFRILSFCCLPYSTTSFAMSIKSDSASPKKKSIPVFVDIERRTETFLKSCPSFALIPNCRKNLLPGF